MKIKLLFAFFILLFFSCFSKAQQADTITISPIVGNVIDSAEKVQNHIFPYYSPKIFIRAIFIRNADSSITLKARLKPDSIAEKNITKQEYDWIKSMIKADLSKPHALLDVKSAPASMDSIWYFSRFHFYIGFGLMNGGVKNKIHDAIDSKFHDLVYHSDGTFLGWGSTYTIEGHPKISFAGLYLGAEYNIKPSFRVGAWMHDFQVYYKGYSGSLADTHSEVTEIINGVRCLVNAQYVLTPVTKPNGRGAEVVLGASFITSFNKANTTIYQLNQNNVVVNGVIVNSATEKYEEKGQSYGAEVFGRLDFCIGRYFSFYLKPSLVFDQGLTLDEKVFSSYITTTLVPEHKINFTGLNVAAGCGFHIGKKMAYKNTKYKK
jgi:hypothetical protein